ncbi:MAG TPA: rRNA adenine N-6-methyltransferase family protein, partial [Gemmatimonadales bacterium]|nr:rRNA adenine N-6-methyltransferase family protein [Gemmatimonadales bacterium]
MRDGSPSRLKQIVLFGRNFLKHPKMLGSVIPSSRFLVGHVARSIDWERARVFVEYGPGVGTITAELLRRMRPDATLIALETNPEFVRFLQRTFADRRLRVVHRSAGDVAAVLVELGVPPADYIISGIPYSTMPPASRDAILRRSREALGEDGVFLVYQFTRAVVPDLRRHFGEVRARFEPLNILPA